MQRPAKGRGAGGHDVSSDELLWGSRVRFCCAVCEGSPGLTHLFLHGDIYFYLFMKISLVLVGIFSLSIHHLH